MQNETLGHDTSLNDATVAPAGCGAEASDQLVPFQRAINTPLGG
jgi:hypothetical protein